MSLVGPRVLAARLTFDVLLATLRTHWLPCTLFMIATCLIRSYRKRVGYQHKGRHFVSQTSPQHSSSFFGPFSALWSPISQVDISSPSEQVLLPRRTTKRNMRYQTSARQFKTKKQIVVTTETPYVIHKTTQPYDAFLVLDLEGTCELGTDFNYPNEIIEFPVRLLQWKDRADDGTASTLKAIDEFRTFVKPTWRPTLSQFCTQLTGITQDQVDSAPRFSEALVKLEAFLVKNGLIDVHTKKRLKRFCWCSDGPWDIRDFFVKQCFISQVEMPEWIRGDILDVRSVVQQWRHSQNGLSVQYPPYIATGIRTPLNISAQLNALDLPAFEGRQHSGIDDTRNIARIVTELARRGVRLMPNTTIYPGRRWRWMGKHGQILQDELP
ncbi:hypothetical protein BDN70DRAFT_873427 [Pholiota conissans]|uniref:Exonuclease domain-containing protein n=1 Tax=Pholiota conissans TaxID=109636 RepID=A0A9P6D591_9AGAR|nr:hypothetical protein BDN70DRAFT_873427 [Pholiota conissans]